MERRFVTAAALLVFAVTGVFLLYKVRDERDGLLNFRGRTAISTNSFFDLNLRPDLAIDDDPSTFWSEEMPGAGGTCLSAQRSTPASDERPPCLFLLTDAGFSHRPARPPIPDMPRTLVVVPGPRDFARPRNARVVFFEQEIVDIDREFRLPTMPVFLAEKSVILADGESRIPLDFLPPARETQTYPGLVRKLWVRLEIESVYPGSKSANKVAISELKVER